MRLTTWNCCGAFDRKLPHLLDLDVDVAVVCEAAVPSRWPGTPTGRTVTGLGRRVVPERPKELAVLACAPWTVELHPGAASAPAWTLPVTVSGPRSFTLVAVWPVAFPGAPGYVGQIDAAVSWIERSADPGTTVLAGDLNAPIASTQARYDEVERRLDGLGLVDAHRVSRGLGAGQQPAEATYFQHRRSDRPFHIDHVFVPTAWTDGVQVEVGDFATWVGSGRSDHTPVTVTLPG